MTVAELADQGVGRGVGWGVPRRRRGVLRGGACRRREYSVQFARLDVPHPKLVVCPGDPPLPYGGLVEAAGGGGFGQGVAHGARLAAVKRGRTMGPPWLPNR